MSQISWCKPASIQFHLRRVKMISLIWSFELQKMQFDVYLRKTVRLLKLRYRKWANVISHFFPRLYCTFHQPLGTTGGKKGGGGEIMVLKQLFGFQHMHTQELDVSMKNAVSNMEHKQSIKMHLWKKKHILGRSYHWICKFHHIKVTEV